MPQDNEALEFTPMTAVSSTVQHPFAKSPKPGLWNVSGMQLSPYIQNVAHALLRNGRAKDESEAIHMAYGIVKRWAQGKSANGKHVSPEVQAAAARNIAEMDAKRMRAHMKHQTPLSRAEDNSMDFANVHHDWSGKFTDHTKERSSILKNFQAQHNLPVTGIIDIATKEVLKEITKAVTD